MDLARAALGVIAIVAAPSLVGCAQVFGPTTATGAMKLIDQSPDPNVRFRAYQTLAQEKVYDQASQRSQAAKMILANLDPSREPLATRATICRTLGALGDPIARDAMIRLVRDPDPMIRSEACRALGKVGRPEDATVLMQMMTLDGDPNCKVAAIEALGSLKVADPRTEGYLVLAMDDADVGIRHAALQSLKKRSGKDLGPKPEPWRAYVLSKGREAVPGPTVPPEKGKGSPTLDASARVASGRLPDLPGPIAGPGEGKAGP